MKKQEAIHLHALLIEVRRYCESRSRREFDLGPYESLGIGPTSFPRLKREHELAIRLLAERLAAEIAASEPSPPRSRSR